MADTITLATVPYLHSHTASLAHAKHRKKYGAAVSKTKSKHTVCTSLHSYISREALAAFIAVTSGIDWSLGPLHDRYDSLPTLTSSSSTTPIAPI
jgi:hypothetical protein